MLPAIFAGYSSSPLPLPRTTIGRSAVCQNEPAAHGGLAVPAQGPCVDRTSKDDAEDVTRLLDEWQRGDTAAYDRLVSVVYDELRRMARGQLRRESLAQSVQPTQLVHEAYMRLVGARIAWVDRAHFLSVAARVMRRILVEHARRRSANKRGGAQVRVTLSDSTPTPTSDPIDVLMLDAALDRLSTFDARQARAIELCYFAGLTYPEIGQMLGVSEATVDRDLRHGRAWLHRELTR